MQGDGQDIDMKRQRRRGGRARGERIADSRETQRTVDVETWAGPSYEIQVDRISARAQIDFAGGGERSQTFQEWAEAGGSSDQAEFGGRSRRGDRSPSDTLGRRKVAR